MSAVVQFHSYNHICIEWSLNNIKKTEGAETGGGGGGGEEERGGRRRKRRGGGGEKGEGGEGEDSFS